MIKIIKNINPFYVFLLLDVKGEKEFQITPIKSLNDLRKNLLIWNDYNRKEDYQGWDPEDYTSDNITTFNVSYDLKEETIKNGSLEVILKFLIENRILLSYEHPKKLTPNDFEDDNNPKFVNISEFISWWLMCSSSIE